VFVTGVQTQYTVSLVMTDKLVDLRGLKTSQVFMVHVTIKWIDY
jgi:hypothetical protein